MHPSALEYGKIFFEAYCNKLNGATVVDLGSQNVNGSLKDVCPSNLKYIGVDFVEGKGVDVVLDDPYNLPFEEGSIDIVVCSSCFEHSDFFWVAFNEILRVLKPSGLLYLNVPSNGYIHRYPVDCWRFYPDAGRALVKWGQHNGYNPALLESFIGKKVSSNPEGEWNDFVAVFIKDKEYSSTFESKITSLIDEYNNAIIDDLIELEKSSFDPEDFRKHRAQQEEITRLSNAHDLVHVELARSTAKLKASQTALRELQASTSWRVTKPLRLLSRLLRGKRPLVAGGVRARLLHHGKRLYWRVPAQYRTPLLSWSYRNLGPLFKGLPHYEQWRSSGAYSGSLPVGSNPMLLIDGIPQAEQADGRIAIHLHMYYHDLADEFAQHLKNMPFEYDLYVSVTNEDGKKACQKAFSALTKQKLLVIEQVPNRGRDIAPMFCTFGARLKDYDYIAHLHSKKSLYNRGATEGWREYLCRHLLGNQERIRRIFTLMQGDGAYGIVYPQNYMLLPYMANTWLANRALGNAWCARLGIGPVPEGYFDFPAGSMFWAKGQALQPLFDAGITLDDFAEESGQTDGTFAHCLERLLVLSSHKQGFKPGIIKDLQTPTWSTWRLDQYSARPFKQIVNQILANDIKLIAFDIFDTLLCRPLMDAESVKAIVAARIGRGTGELYLQYRSLAESQAREAAGKDIGMIEIFSYLGKLTGLPDETLAQLRNLEEKVEKASVGPRSGGMELYKQALKTGKTIALISDMFLPREVIEESLRANGITGWDKFFLSNEIGLRKDRGTLYEHVLSHYGISPAEMVMIGDNERSDFQIPCDKGIVGIHLLKSLEFARGLPRFKPLIETNERSMDVHRELTLGLVLRQNFSAISYPELDPASLVQPTPFNVGYSLIGPLLVGISQWLVENANRDTVDQLYFLAREGQLMKRVYDLWSESLEGAPRADYLVLSRRSVSVPMLENLEDILSIAKATYYPNNISHFLHERFGVQLSAERWAELSKEVGWNSNSTVEVHNQQVDHLLPLLKALEAEILTIATRERGALKHYLDTMGFGVSGHKAVVDVGYGATIQDYLNRLVPTPIHGYYMITDQRSSRVTQRHNVTIRGCYLENVEQTNNSPLMYRHSFGLEKLLSSNDAQIVHYELDQEKNLKAHYRKLTDMETKSFSFREELQEGVMRYARDAKDIREQVLPSYKPSCAVAKQLYEAFITQQSQLEVELLQKVALDDHYCGRGVI